MHYNIRDFPISASAGAYCGSADHLSVDTQGSVGILTVAKAKCHSTILSVIGLSFVKTQLGAVRATKAYRWRTHAVGVLNDP